MYGVRSRRGCGGLLTYFTQRHLDKSRFANERQRDEEAADRQRQRDEEAADRQRERDEEAEIRQHQRDHVAAERDRKREQAAWNVEFQVAKRLVLEELDTIALHYSMLADAGHYPRPQGQTAGQFMFPTTAWEETKRTLAKALPDKLCEAWITVMHPVAAFVDSSWMPIPSSPSNPKSGKSSESAYSSPLSCTS